MQRWYRELQQLPGVDFENGSHVFRKWITKTEGNWAHDNILESPCHPQSIYFQTFFNMRDQTFVHLNHFLKGLCIIHSWMSFLSSMVSSFPLAIVAPFNSLILFKLLFSCELNYPICPKFSCHSSTLINTCHFPDDKNPPPRQRLFLLPVFSA